MRRLVLFAIALLASQPAWACSPAEENYRPPSNFELVQRASVIVLARVKDLPSEALGRAPADRLLTLEPVRFLKGSAPAASLRIMGWRAPPNWAGGVPTVGTLSQAHWSSGLGACIRQFYEPGELIVAFFEENEENRSFLGSPFGQAFHAFARVAKTVESQSDLWVHAIELYLRIIDGPASGLPVRIEKAKSELDSLDTPEAQAIAADLAHHQNPSEKSRLSWAAMSMPMLTTAAPVGQKQAIL